MDSSRVSTGSIAGKIAALRALVGLLVLGIANGGGFTPTGIAQAIPATVVVGGAIVWFL
ncbi:hypothetical protein [Halonotius pteroides]|uniref:hypothetical protein n=1 Tax=Halonotius pteroides TaxID=268735 RepID=UPI0014037E9B|nr:hypothetical protein [Halonotius pteroides]